MTKMNQKFFLENLGIEPTRENMIKFYRCGWTKSEILYGDNYIEKGIPVDKEVIKKLME